MQKTVGAACPACREPFTAEHQQIDQHPRWTCNSCGESGDLIGELSFPKKATAEQQQPATKRHWTQR